ncbi:hypothetical protein O6H91_05G013000 [Diphasiastrum complanatum]|uniref:Uncharacterized protein n=1 Tax=Diphasiastrum complanatum TaxID=34168 RepID=A0ACC2DKQ6_DIPCM|nr:hypothetical protein O6H91_05G013000 [Diphasiastrum complanatum]
MAYGLQDRDNSDEFETFDPLPYSGGYDIAAIYGRIKPAAPDHSYSPRTDREEGFEASYDESVTADYANAKPSCYGQIDASHGSEAPDSGYGRHNYVSESYGYAAQEPPAEEEVDEDGYSAHKPAYASSGYGRPHKSQYSEDEPSQGYGGSYGRPSYSDEKPVEYVEDEPPPQSGYGFGGQYGAEVPTDEYASRPEKHGSGKGRRPGYGSQYGSTVEVDPEDSDSWRKNEDEYEKPVLGGRHSGSGRHEGHRRSHGIDSEYIETEGEVYGESGHYRPHGGRRTDDEVVDAEVYGESGTYRPHGGRRADDEVVDTEGYGESGKYRAHGGRRAEDYGVSSKYDRHGGRRTDEEELSESTEGLPLEFNSSEGNRPYYNQPRRRWDNDTY